MKYLPDSVPLERETDMLEMGAVRVSSSIQSVPPGLTVAFNSPTG